MSRSGYHEGDGEGWALIRWRGAVASALRGKRGQSFLREMLTALDALSKPELVPSVLVTGEGGCCAMGAVAIARKQDVSAVDPYEPDQVADAFDIAEAMAQELAYVNDDDDYCGRASKETPKERFARVRKWVARSIKLKPEELTNEEAG